MTELFSTMPHSIKRGRHRVSPGGTLPKAVLDGSAGLCKKLQRLCASDLTALLLADQLHHCLAQPGILRATRMHALADAEAFLSALMDLHILVRGRAASRGAAVSKAGTANERVAPLRPIIEVHQAIDTMGPNVVIICKEAGLSTPEAVLASHRWVRRVALYMSGYAGHVFGKPRQRHLKAISHDAERLLDALPRLRKWAQADAQARRDRALLARAQTITATPEALLPRLLSNATRLLREIALSPPGGAEVPDPVRYAAEGVWAIWIQHHSKAPTLSRNSGGFLVFGETLLGLSVKALGQCPEWIKPTTFETALRGVLKDSTSTIIH